MVPDVHLVPPGNLAPMSIIGAKLHTCILQSLAWVLTKTFSILALLGPELSYRLIHS